MKDLVFGLTSSAVGLLALLIALGFGVERALFLSRADSAPGIVIELRDNPRSNSTRRGKYPVVEFTPPGAPARRCEGWSSYPPRYAVSERVTVHYDPAHPESARLDDFLELWLAPLISGGIALLFVPAGGLVLALHSRRRARERLRTTGIAVVGTVVEVETSSVEEWGKTVQYLTLAATDPRSGTALRLRSHRVPGKGDEWLGRQLTVYLDPKSPGRYLVDAPHPGG